jgi:hypothetical protein
MRMQTKKYGIYAGLLLSIVTTASATTLVTFQVDMSAAIANALFDPNTQTMAVHGSFNGWNAFPLTNNPSGPNPALYTGTTNLPINGSVMQYKYTIEPGASYEAVYMAGNHNRLITLPATSGASLVLPKVFYGDAPITPVTTLVTFQVNLAQQINTGAFDTNTSIVEARGAYIGWGTTFTMTNDPTILTTNQFGLVNSNVYVYTFEITGSPGQSMNYKYYIDTGANWDSPAPGTGDPADVNNNRFFNLGEGPTQNLPIVYFSDAPYAPLATNAVTFQVDLTGKIVDQEFDPTTGTVELRGSFNGWGTPQILCTNDPTALNTNIYKAVVSLSDGIGAFKQYKFWASISTNTGWETFNNNRTCQIVSGTAQTLPVVYFDNVVPNAGRLSITPFGSDMQLDWFGHPGIRVQSNTNLSGGTWVDDLSTDGQSTATYPVVIGPKFYRLRYQP